MRIFSGIAHMSFPNKRLIHQASRLFSNSVLLLTKHNKSFNKKNSKAKIMQYLSMFKYQSDLELLLV